MVQRTISSNQPEWNLQSVVDAVKEEDDTLVVESGGKPTAAVISFERFQKLRELENVANKQRAMSLLREIEARYDGRNDDLTDEQIEELAVRAGREINRAAAEWQRQIAKKPGE